MTDSDLAKKTISGIHEVAARGAHVIIICSQDILEAHSLPSFDTLTLPKTEPLLYPFLSATVTQLIAYHTSADKGFDVDKPRNLAKSVTVE